MMKVKKMLGRLMDYFNADKHQQLADLKSIRKVLRKLKQKERELKSAFKEAKNAEQKEAVQNKLDVIYAQRTKGMQVVKALREQLKTGQPLADSAQACPPDSEPVSAATLALDTASNDSGEPSADSVGESVSTVSPSTR